MAGLRFLKIFGAGECGLMVFYIIPLFRFLKTFGTGVVEGIVISKFFKNFFPKIYPP
jgi:hypothetical protein